VVLYTRAMRATRRSFVVSSALAWLGVAPALAATDPTAPSGGLRFMRLRHASLLIEIGERRVVVDPWLTKGPGGGLVVDTGDVEPTFSERVGRVDLLLLTSSTLDRLDSSTLRALEDKRASCLVPDERAEKVLRRAGFSRVRTVQVDVEEEVGGLVVTPFLCREAGLLAASVGFHVAGAGRSFLVAGAVPPIVVDDRVARSARAMPAEIVFLPRPDDLLTRLDPQASDDDLVLVARLARARAVVPIADTVRPGPLMAPLASLVDVRAARLESETDDDPRAPGPRARGPRVVHADPWVWYRLPVATASRARRRR